MRFTPIEQPLDEEPQSRFPPLPRRLLISAGVLVALLAAIMLGIALLSFYENRSVNIHYIIPNDYRGPLKIVGDGDDAGGYSLDKGRHVYRFPRSGVLHVKTTWPMNAWHRVTAQYENGARIYWVEPPPPNSDAIRVAELGGSGEGGGLTAYWEVVGDVKQVKHWQDVWNGGGADNGLEKRRVFDLDHKN